MGAEKDYSSYSSNYSESSFWNKVARYAKKAGKDAIHHALKLYYALENPSIPMWVKGSIYGALGYFILPIDVVPDIVPVLGFGDDLVALASATGVAHMYIDGEVKEKAEKRWMIFSGNIFAILRNDRLRSAG